LSSIESKDVHLHEHISDWRLHAIRWGKDSDQYLLYGIKSLELGHPSIAYEIFMEGLKQVSNHPELTYRAALALSRCRSTASAGVMINQLLERIPESGPITADAYSLAGRLAKDQWAMTADTEKKTRLAWDSTAKYKRAYKISKDYYPGINAASMSILAGDEIYGKKLAENIKSQCIKLISQNKNDDYWLTATLGEAYLLLNQQEESAKWYQKAKTSIKNDYGNLASIRRQVKLLKEVIPVDDEIIKLLNIPSVVVFTGHMIDAANRENGRFTPDMVIPVKKAIVDAIERLGTDFGYCSAACGADILFIEAMLESDREVHIILPFKQDDFLETSVSFAGESWVQRFNNVLSRVESIHYATEEGYLNDDTLFEYCASLMSGMAILRADLLESEPVLLSVMESDGEMKTGGTSNNVLNWKRCGHKMEIIDLNKIKPKPSKETSNHSNKNHNKLINNNTSLSHSLSREIKTMLFADVVGFSKLAEEESPNFFVNFLNKVAETINSQFELPVFCNTWGDGLFLVYDDIEVAADVALCLRDAVLDNDWVKFGLPEETNIRIGMHAGPVFSANDPIINKTNFYGSHVNRAARIEPITTPGSIFISEQTACLLTLTNNQNYICDYLGPIDLAKRYGTGVLYRLRRMNEAE
jgi:class 3 adenylate cyclase/tetratricopeptide (TPR) repeat protein